MKLKFGKVTIDTKASREEIMEEVKHHTHLHCSNEAPYYFFTYDLPNKNQRFVEIHFDHDGVKLLKINSWEYVHKEWIEVKVKIEQCYFTKNDETKWKTTRVLEDKPSYEHNYIWWYKGNFMMNDYEPPKIIVDMADGAVPKNIPDEIIQKKKRWGIF